MIKNISLVLSALMLLNIFVLTATAQEDIDYEITNPYANVDFEEWNAYKTQLHCHTNASDGFLAIKESVQWHYDLDYDIVAITDHGTINKGWNIAPQLIPLVRLVKYERTQMADIIPLTSEEYEAFTTGTAQTSNGFVRTHDTGMLDVEKGIELNMATPFADCHLTGYWSNYGQGLAGVYGDYETPAAEVKKDGGITMLSHVGEYVYTDKNSQDYVGKPIDDYYPTKFARLFIDNKGSAVGMGINSSQDEHTRCDRILYDQILQKTIPNGVVPWGFTFSDSHNIESLNRAYTYSYMPELSQDALRNCMVNGEFFSVSHYSNGVELNGMKELPDYEPDTMRDTNNMFNTPMVTNVIVDEESDTITVETENANQITWVSDCNVVLRDEIVDNTFTFDLNRDDLLDDINLYLRFYFTGEEGICYANPFVVKPVGTTFEPVEVPETNDISVFLRKLVTVIDWLFFKLNPVVWIFKYAALGYDPFAQLVGKGTLNN